jgi:arginyl-tRNA--protein-N-Asp/Glu arginylyltransferase
MTLALRLVFLLSEYFHRLVIFAIMLVQTASIHGLKRADYDELLAHGWFRGNGIVYRSEVVCIDDKVYGILNIRYRVAEFNMRRSHLKLFKRNQTRFKIKIGTPRCDSRREELYRGAMPRFKAFVHGTLEEALLSPSAGAEFDAMEISVFDGDTLVAVSYIDVGDHSMASILCIYDQRYNKHSLGIYTMLIELDLCKRMGLEFYYPGYVLDEPSSFDYKLGLGSCEWLDEGKVWKKDLSELSVTKGMLMRLKMVELSLQLSVAGYKGSMRVYPYYTLGHLLLERPDLIRVPSYYVIQTPAGELAVAYDLQMETFICFDVHPVDDLDFLSRLKLSNDYLEGVNYQLEPLRCTFFHRLRTEHFKEDLEHIIQLQMHAAVVEY